MPAYLSQIAASSAAGSRRTLSPAIRSRSPIAERDQRLTLTEVAWNFEDTLASGAAIFEATLPMEPETTFEPAVPKQTPEKSAPDPSSPIPVMDELPPVRPDSRPQALPESAPHPLRIASARIKPSAAASNVPSPDPQPLAENSPSPREQISEQTAKSGIQIARPTQDTTDHSEQPQRRTPQMAVPMPSKANAGALLPVVNKATAPQAGEPVSSSRDFHETRCQKQPLLPKLAPLAEYQTTRRPQPAELEPYHESTRPSVIINHIEVEVVPPPAEKSASKPASPAPARSAPVSQIGPLRGVAKHLAFSIRHR